MVREIGDVGRIVGGIIWSEKSEISLELSKVPVLPANTPGWG